MTRQVTVIGGGPAGMAAAFFAAQAGAHVTLLEKNEKLGKKLYLTGKGRCNVTNTAENPFAFIPRNPKFLRSAFARLDSCALRALLEAYGCHTKVERANRVFPISDKASDVTKAMERALRAAGVSIQLNHPALEIGPYVARGAVVLATGGRTYPQTGSTGDGYAFARQVGHTIHAPRPALVPLCASDAWTHALQGLSLKNVRLTAKAGKKLFYSEQGEMLFTHFGISGPLVLTLSSHLTEDDLQALQLTLDMKPALTLEQVDHRLRRDFDAAPRKQLDSVLPQLVPARMAEILPQLCRIPGSNIVGQITREERIRLAECLKAIPIHLSAFRPLEEAIITRGGVDVREVNPKTMMSKCRDGLFFAGELLDVDAYTGGFNLQIAFSTGALAGEGAAAYCLGSASHNALE